MYGESIPDNELARRCREPTDSEPSELWARELLEAGLIALMEAEAGQSIAAALLAAELMDAGWAVLDASERCDADLALLTARGACRPSRAPRRA